MSCKADIVASGLDALEYGDVVRRVAHGVDDGAQDGRVRPAHVVQVGVLARRESVGEGDGVACDPSRGRAARDENGGHVRIPLEVGDKGGEVTETVGTNNDLVQNVAEVVLLERPANTFQKLWVPMQFGREEEALADAVVPRRVDLIVSALRSLHVANADVTP